MLKWPFSTDGGMNKMMKLKKMSENLLKMDN